MSANNDQISAGAPDGAPESPSDAPESAVHEASPEEAETRPEDDVEAEADNENDEILSARKRRDAAIQRARAAEAKASDLEKRIVELESLATEHQSWARERRRANIREALKQTRGGVAAEALAERVAEELGIDLVRADAKQLDRVAIEVMRRDESLRRSTVAPSSAGWSGAMPTFRNKSILG